MRRIGNRRLGGKNKTLRATLFWEDITGGSDITLHGSWNRFGVNSRPIVLLQNVHN